MQHDASELSRMLASRMQTLAAELLPVGRRDGPEWRCGSLAGEAGQSLAIRVLGDRAGLWCDFATGERGDALDLVAAVRFSGSIKEALDWARAWLGLTGSQPARPADVARPSPQAGPQVVDVDHAARKAKALGLFLSAREGLIGTPVAAYLASRGINLAELGRSPRALRFHPAVWCQEAAATLPAMLAAITNGKGEHVATHRTWIAKNIDGQWTKATLRDAKKTLGSYAGGFIPLQRGASGRPLRTAPEGEVVAIAEGIETALSVAVVCPELRVLAAVSLSNMTRIVLPEPVRTVIICMDNDGLDNHAAERALKTTIDHFASVDRLVRLARPPAGKDFNDSLRAGNP